MSNIDVTNFLAHSSHMLLDADILCSKSFKLSRISNKNYTDFEEDSHLSSRVRCVRNAEENLSDLIQLPSNFFQLKALIIRLIDPNCSVEEKQKAFLALDEEHQNQLSSFLPEHVNIHENPSELLNYWVGNQNIIEAYLEALQNQDSFHPTPKYESKLAAIQNGFTELSAIHYDKILINKLLSASPTENDQADIEAIFKQSYKLQDETARFELLKKIITENPRQVHRMIKLISLFDINNSQYRKEIMELVYKMPDPTTNYSPNISNTKELMDQWNYSSSQRRQFVIDQFPFSKIGHHLDSVIKVSMQFGLSFDDIKHVISQVTIYQNPYSINDLESLKLLISKLKPNKTAIFLFFRELIKKKIIDLNRIDTTLDKKGLSPLIDGEMSLALAIESISMSHSIDIPEECTIFDKLLILLKKDFLAAQSLLIKTGYKFYDVSFFTKEQRFELFRLAYNDEPNLVSWKSFNFTDNEKKELLFHLLEHGEYKLASNRILLKKLSSDEAINLIQNYLDAGHPTYIPLILSVHMEIEPTKKWELAEKLMDLGYAHKVLRRIQVFELNKIEDSDKRIQFFEQLVRSSIPSALPIIGIIIHKVEIPSSEARLSLAKYDFNVHGKEVCPDLENYQLQPIHQEQFFYHILAKTNHKISSKPPLAHAIISALQAITLDADNQKDFKEKCMYLSYFMRDLDTNAIKIYEEMVAKEGEINATLAITALPIAIFLSKDGWDHIPSKYENLIQILDIVCKSPSHISLYIQTVIELYDQLNDPDTSQGLPQILLFQNFFFGTSTQKPTILDGNTIIQQMRNYLWRPNLYELTIETLKLLNQSMQSETATFIDKYFTRYQIYGIKTRLSLNNARLSVNEKKTLFKRILDFHHSRKTSLQIKQESELIEKISRHGNSQVALEILSLFCSHYSSKTSELFNHLAKKPSLLMPSMLIATMLSDVDENTLPESTIEAISHTIHRLHRELKDTSKLTTWVEFCIALVTWDTINSDGDELAYRENLNPLEKVQMLHLAMMNQKGLNNHDLLVQITKNFTISLIALEANKKDALLQIYQTWQTNPSISIQEQFEALLKSIISESMVLNTLNEDDIEKFLQVFIYKARNPLACLTYINRHKDSSINIKEEIQRFVKAVINDSFKETRYETTNNPHLTKIKQEHEAIYNRWSEPVHIEPISPYLQDTRPDEENKTDWSLFLKEKLEHQHWSPVHFPKLAEFIRLPKEAQTRLLADYQELAASSASSAELKIMELLSLEPEDERPKLAEIKEELRKIDPTMELINDIESQLTLPSSSSSAIFKDFVIQDTDDWEDLFLSGTEVVGSCQRVDGDPVLNKALLGYVMDGKNRMIAIKNKKGNIIGRQIFRLLWNPKTNQPCLFMEPLYSVQNNKEIQNIMLNYAKKRAKEIGCELFVVGDRPNSNGATLESLGSCSPFEYTDSGEPKIAKKGIFSTYSCVQIPLE